MRDKETYSLVHRAWHMASWDAKRRYDRWLTENMQISGDVADWHVAQLRWMESDPEFSECVMLARLMG